MASVNDRIRNEDTTELGIFSFNQKTETNGKKVIRRMHGTLIPEQALIYKVYGGLTG